MTKKSLTYWHCLIVILSLSIFSCSDDEPKEVEEPALEISINTLTASPEGGIIAAFSADGKGYVLMENSNLYEYEPVADEWTQKTSFPGVMREKGYGFSIDDTGYFGMGMGKTDLWAYDPEDNSWQELTISSTLNIGGIYKPYSTLMVIGNIVYVGNGTYEKMSAGTITNESISWEENIDFPDNSDTPIFVSINGNGYWGGSYLGSSVYSSKFFKYIPASNAWTPLNDLPGELLRGHNNGPSIVMGDKAYVAEENKIWIYNPAKDFWKFVIYENFPNPEIYFVIDNTAYIVLTDGSLYEFKTTN